MLEQRYNLLELLSEALREDGVYLRIGHEMTPPSLQACSLVAANYGVANRNLGTVSVLGPDAHGLPARDRDRARHRRQSEHVPRRDLVTTSDWGDHEARLLRRPRRAPRRRRRRDQEGLPQAGPRVPPGREPGGPGVRGAVQGGGRGLRGAQRRRHARRLRPLRLRRPARPPDDRLRARRLQRPLQHLLRRRHVRLGAARRRRHVGRGERQRAGAARRRRRGAPRPHLRRVRVRRHQGRRGHGRRAVRDLRRQRRRPAPAASTCPQCHGSGRMREVSSLGGFGQFIRTSTCNVCRGQGSIVKEPCETCRGTGRAAPDAHRAPSTCRPASPTGSACASPARAAPAPRAAGPATCTCPSPSSRTSTSCATATTSSTGSTSPWSRRRWAPPPTCPRSTATSRWSSSPARSPARSRSYRNRGVPVLQGYGRGDLKVVVNVQVPRHLSDEQRELLEQFAALTGDAELRARPELPRQGPGRLPPVTRPQYTRYTLRLEPPAAARDRTGAAAAAERRPTRPTTGPAPRPTRAGPDDQALDYAHPEAVAAILRPAAGRLAGGGRRATRCVFWLEEGAEADAERRAALRRLGALGRLEVARERPGWEDAWRRFHKPHVIGRLYVRPPWYPARDDLLDVVVEAGLAFGTGGHASTRQCLEEIQTIPPGSLLDLGSGSGVVSFAALRLGFAPVVRHRHRPGRRARRRRQRGPERARAHVPGRRRHRPRATRCRRPTWSSPTSRSARSCGWRAVAARRTAAAPAARRRRPTLPRRRRTCCSPGCSSSRASEAAAAFPAFTRRRATRRRHLADAAPHEARVTRVAAAFVGCKVSQADGEEALARPRRRRPASRSTASEAADVVVVHTCCVTAEAERKSRRLVRRAAAAGRRVVVAGCAAALHPEQFDGRGRDRGGAARLGGAGRAAGRGAARAGRRRSGAAAAGAAAPRATPRRAHAARAQGAGRLRRRAARYCVVRLVRGRAAQHAAGARPSRPPAPASPRGCGEVVLSGIDLGAWRDGDARLPDLVAALAELRRPARACASRRSSRGTWTRACWTLLAHPRVARHLHVPLQSADDGVLRGHAPARTRSRGTCARSRGLRARPRRRVCSAPT